MVLLAYPSAPRHRTLIGKSDLLPEGSEEPVGVRHHGRMEDELEVLRRQIDAVDEQFVQLLAERFRITRRVGAIKAERGLPAQDAIREAQIDAKVRRLAADHELDEGLVSDVLRAVIDRVVAEHRELHPR